MSGNTELRVSLLFEANHGAAKTAVAEMRGATDDLNAAMREAGGAAGAASDGVADWGSIVQMTRAQLQPMVAEADALSAGMQQLAVAEQMGALSAREATLAHDMLSRQMTDLQARMDAAGVTLDGTTASVMRQDTALQQLINGSAGLSRAEGQSIADHLRHGQALDQLRARFDPVFAAQRQYEILLLDIADAERQGAIAADVAADARTRAGQALATASGQVTQMGVSSGAAASYVANLGYQLNDIGMMLAAGQSPFMLTMQQGPQVVQVFAQMRAAGMAIGPAIASAFTSMLNPLSFATMAVIGFGAAALQWFMDAAEEAESLGDAVSGLASQVQNYKAAMDNALIPMSELRREWGDQAEEVRALYEALADLERLKSLSAIDAAVSGVDAAFSGLEDRLYNIDRLLEQQAAGDDITFALQRQLAGLMDEFGLTEQQARRLAAALEDLSQAQGPDEIATAAAALRSEFASVAIEAGRLPGPLVSVAENIVRAEVEARKLAGPLKDSETYARRLASMNMSTGIAAAAHQASILAQNLGVSLAIAQELANINGSADPKVEEPKPRVGFGPGIGPAGDPILGGVPELRFGDNSGSPRPGTRDSRFNPEAGADRVFTDPVAGLGRGGGGGGAADEAAEAIKRQREALEDLITSEQQQIAMMLETDPVQREIMRNHEALKGATAEEREEVEQLIAERMRLEEVKSRIEEIGRAGEQAFVGLVTGAMSFKDAIGQLISKLAEMAASAAWDSLMTGLGGSIFGGLVSAIFGGGAAAPVVKAADGGKVYGRGGPRDDLVPAWLSNGEYVVNAAATAAHLPLIEAMNAGASMADLAAIIGGARPSWPAFADGGLFGSVNGSAAPSGWGLSGSRGGNGLSGGGAMKVTVEVRAFFDDREGKMMAEVQRVSQEVAVQTTLEGIETFSAHQLPSRMAEIDANPRIYG